MEKGKLIQNKVHLRDHEYNTVKLFLEQGYDIELIPPSQISGLRLPDIMMCGVPWEIKSPVGHGKNNMKHTIQNAKPQSSNIIVDLRRSDIPTEKAIKDLEHHFKLSKRVRRMKIVVDDEKILDYKK